MALIERDINEIVASSIDKCLDKIGCSFKEIFYWSFEKREGVKRQEIADKPEEFVRYLDKMFGSGSGIIKEELLFQIEADLGASPLVSDLASLIRNATLNDLV